ncbi:MAG: hypothetical protein PHE08_08575 [Bacteroidales bacterium]|jgi:hypothetical protein|nr:hypothetical protein [Bacteroidales bacterium]
MKKTLVIVLLVLIVVELGLFELVMPVQGSQCSQQIDASCQSPCECGGGWYCSSDKGSVIYYYRLPIIHTCVGSEPVECSYWCLCCPCNISDKCIMPGDTCT